MKWKWWPTKILGIQRRHSQQAFLHHSLCITASYVQTTNSKAQPTRIDSKQCHVELLHLTSTTLRATKYERKSVCARKIRSTQIINVWARPTYVLASFLDNANYKLICNFSLCTSGMMRIFFIFKKRFHSSLNHTRGQHKRTIFPSKPYTNATTKTETYSLAPELLLPLVGGVLLVMYRFVLRRQPEAAVAQQLRDAKAQLLLALDAADQPLVFPGC